MLPAIACAVVLHLANAAGVPPTTLAKAQAEVVRVYRDIGVDVQWSASGIVPGASVQSVHVIVVPVETGELRRQPQTVMGAATRTPHGAQIAYVFYRRVAAEAAQYDVSQTGTLVYRRSAGNASSTVQWLGPADKQAPLVARAGAYVGPPV